MTLNSEFKYNLKINYKALLLPTSMNPVIPVGMNVTTIKIYHNALKYT